MQANQSAEGDRKRDQQQASRGRGQGRPRVTAASSPAAQGLFVSCPERHTGALSGKETERLFLFSFFPQ